MKGEFYTKAAVGRSGVELAKSRSDDVRSRSRGRSGRGGAAGGACAWTHSSHFYLAKVGT